MQNGGNNACQGSLVCQDNKCVRPFEGEHPVASPVMAPVASPVKVPPPQPTGTNNNDAHEIKMGANCLTVNRQKGNVIEIQGCNFWLNQKFKYDKNSHQIKSMIPNKDFCLAWDNEKGIIAEDCDSDTKWQKWYFDQTVKGTTAMIRVDNQQYGYCLEKNLHTSRVEITNSCNFAMNQQFHKPFAW